ncbi:MAG: hypothetical protein R2879_14420 [Saprospiraceae bacterium]
MKSFLLNFCYSILLCVFFLFFKNNGKAQDDFHFKKLATFSHSRMLAASDPLGFFFVLDEKGLLLKLDTLGKEQFRYSTTRDGELKYIDTYNGLQILCWFPDFQKIILLDRTLQPQGEINLTQQGIFLSNAVKTAMDGNIWVFDDNNFQIKKLDRFGKEIMAGNRLDLVLEAPWHPVYLYEYDNKVYLTDPEKGILVLDVFGNYVKTIPIKGLNYFFIRDEKLVFQKDNSFKAFNLNALLEESFETDLEVPEGIKVFWEGKYCFAFFKDKIEIFTIQAN